MCDFGYYISISFSLVGYAQSGRHIGTTYLSGPPPVQEEHLHQQDVPGCSGNGAQFDASAGMGLYSFNEARRHTGGTNNSSSGMESSVHPTPGMMTSFQQPGCSSASNNKNMSASSSSAAAAATNSQYLYQQQQQQQQQQDMGTLRRGQARVSFMSSQGFLHFQSFSTLIFVLLVTNWGIWCYLKNSTRISFEHLFPISNRKIF